MAVGVPGVIGICTSALVFAMGAQPDLAPADPGEVSVPRELADYSHLTGSVSDSAPGAAVALYQHGWGVEFLDFPQAVVLGAGGDVYRRVDVAEDRAGGETQGDPAPMLLSPDGTKVAVGDHDTDRPDVVVVDLRTGATTTHPLPTGSSVVPVAWSSDSRTLANLLSPAPTNPYSGARITGDIGLLDTADDTTDLLQEETATAAAFSPDGSELAIEQAREFGVRISVLDLQSGERRGVGAVGVLAGPTAWSPDGRLLATTTVRASGAPPGVDDPGIPTGLSFVDPTRRDSDLPAPLELPLPGPGRILGWSGSDEVLVLLDLEGDDGCCGPDAYTLSSVPLDGATPSGLMRMSDLQSYGIGRFQLASATVGDLQVVNPGEVDRGDWPLPARIFLALLGGFVAWLAVRLLRRMVRALVRVRAAGTPGAQSPVHQLELPT